MTWTFYGDSQSRANVHVDLDGPFGLPAFSIVQALEGRMYDDRVGSQVPATRVITLLRSVQYSLTTAHNLLEKS